MWGHLTADRWSVMVLALSGEPVPPPPAIAGRVHGVIAAERLDTLTRVVFGDDGMGKARRLQRTPDVVALLDDP